MLVKSHLIRFFIIFTVSVVLSYREKYKQIEKEKIKAELSVLKAKINPHFLFNTLNGIYAQALTMSDNTAGSIAKLSSIMRYSLTETDEDRVSLEKEIDYLKNYIELQKLRLTDKTNVIFEVKGITTSKQIAPMLFIHFIENAFKYGISNEEETQIKISISIENDDLSFTVFNNKVTNTNNQDSTKLGIKDTKHRLELIYPNRYFLDIFDDNKSFEVKLKIKYL